MVHTLERANTAESDPGNGSGEVELPTNRLSSTSLQEDRVCYASSAESHLDQIDWVRTLTTVNPVTQQFADEAPEPPPAPSGMGHHITGPARMVPAKRTLVPGALKRALVALLLVLAVGGAAGAGVYALVDSGLLASALAPRTSAPIMPPIVSRQGTPQSATQPIPPTTSVPTTSVPTATAGQPAVATGVVAASLYEMRDKGIEEYKLGNFDKAIQILEAVVGAGTDDARTYYHLGLAYLAVTGRARSLDDAELAFRTAVSLDPTWAAAHNMLAESLLRRGYYAEAIPQALEATRLDPNSSDAWLTLSRAYKGAGQEAEATRAYAEAARRAPAPPGP